MTEREIIEALNEGNTETLRKLWRALVLADGRQTLAQARASDIQEFTYVATGRIEPREVVAARFDRLRNRLIKSVKTDKKDWQIGHFGKREYTWVYTADESAWVAALAKINLSEN